MATAVKRLLSESVDGKPINIVETSTPGDTIHTAVNSTVDGTYDEVWIWAQNNDDEDVDLVIEFGDDDISSNITVAIPSKAGLVPVIPGLPLQNGGVVGAFSTTASGISLVGFVNYITD